MGGGVVNGVPAWASVVMASLFVAACGGASDPVPEEERVRADRERSAALEEAQKAILNVGLPLPAEPGAEPAATDDNTALGNGVEANIAANEAS